MPNTTNYDFEYETPSSLPGTTLTGGVSGGSPVLAQQVDSALGAVETKVDVNTTNITANASDLADTVSDVEDLTDWTQTGVELVSFSSSDAETQAVSFGFTFPSNPNVHVNINTGSGSAARWQSRAVNITTTGFDIFVFASSGGDTSTWSDIPVAWTAIYRP